MSMIYRVTESDKLQAQGSNIASRLNEARKQHASLFPDLQTFRVTPIIANGESTGFALWAQITPRVKDPVRYEIAQKRIYANLLATLPEGSTLPSAHFSNDQALDPHTQGGALVFESAHALEAVIGGLCGMPTHATAAAQGDSQGHAR